MALGSSGSGKTVLCKIVVEEAVRCGIPVICIDPQGDLCSLALTPEGSPQGSPQGSPDEAAVESGASGDTSALASGTPPSFLERADVVVFTPASRRGVPLCADPLHGPADDLTPADKVQALSRAADMIVSLLGYDGDSDDGAGLRAVIDTALADMDAAGRPAHRLQDLTGYLTDVLEPAAGTGESERVQRYERFLDARKLRTACRRMARLEVGARRLLFHEGLPVDIDMLLGGPERAPDKTRVSVIYLNTLHSQEDKDFFVATLVERLYTWMLRNPSSEPQALFYIDEIAPFMPPVRKPACKSGLQLLFKQARKYGVGCLMATQNPGDVDYKAMAQFGTWALGRLTTRQDIKKIAPVIKAMAHGAADPEQILADLPSRRPGEFTVLAPDHFDEPVPLNTRWLHSAHLTLDEARIESLTDERWRERFSAMERPVAPPVAAVPATAKTKRRAPEGPSAAGDVASDERESSESATKPVATESAGQPASSRPARTAQASNRSPLESRAVADDAPATADRAQAAPDDAKARELDRFAGILATVDSGNAREIGNRAKCGQAKARRLLNELVDAGRARKYREGRGYRYFACERGHRPDLGLGATVAIVRPSVDEKRARELAQRLRRTAFLGLFGEDEELLDAQLVYLPVYQVTFTEMVPRTGFGRLFGARDDQLVGTVYHHPDSLQLVVFSQRRGVEFVDQGDELASRIDDFDGVARFDDVAPGTIAIDEAAWQARRTEAEVEAYFRDRFNAQPGAITPVFVPLWKMQLRQVRRGNHRLLWLDGLVGKPVIWPTG